jgi:hypothetical protein
MSLSSTQRHAILLPLTFLVGVWVGHGWLKDEQPHSRDDRRGSEIWGGQEQISPFASGNEDRTQAGVSGEGRSLNKLDNSSPITPKPSSSGAIANRSEGDLPVQQSNGTSAMADTGLPSDQKWSEAYSFEDGATPELSTTERSPQYMVNAISSLLEEAGIPSEEIQTSVENLMTMLQNPEQTPEAYPGMAADR